MLLGLLGGAAKGIGRDLGMGFGVTERDQDYFDRTRETLRKQYGDARAALYEQQTAAQRAAAPRGRVEKPKRSEKGILSTIIGDLKLGLPNQRRSMRATSSGSGFGMSSSLMPMVRPFDLPLSNMGFIGANNREEALKRNEMLQNKLRSEGFIFSDPEIKDLRVQRMLVDAPFDKALENFPSEAFTRGGSGIPYLMPPMETPPSTDKSEILESYNRLMETIPEGTSELVRQQYEDYILKSGGRKPFTEIFPE